MGLEILRGTAEVDAIEMSMRKRLGRRARRRVRMVGLGCSFIAVAIWAIYEAAQPGPWQQVFATREGLTGRRLACGEIIEPGALFVAVALHPVALRKNVELRYGGGPWSSRCWTSAPGTWMTTTGPPAAAGLQSADAARSCNPTNHAGIDLSDATFAALGLRDNSPVEWRFVHRGYIPLPRAAIAAGP